MNVGESFVWKKWNVFIGEDTKYTVEIILVMKARLLYWPNSS